MKYCRFRFENEIQYGSVEDRAGEPWIVDLVDAPPEDLAFHLERARGSGKKALVADPAAFDFDPIALSEAELLPPVTPSKIVCVGRNYRDSREGTGQRSPAGTAALLQAAVVTIRTQGHSVDASAGRAGRL